MTLEQSYFLGFFTLPGILVVVALYFTAQEAIVTAWRSRNAQGYFTVRCPTCKRGHSASRKRRARQMLREHIARRECEPVSTRELLD